MVESPSDQIVVELSPAEARLIVAALAQFEPYWPSDMEAMDRWELLAGIRQGIEHVMSVLEEAQKPTP